MGSQFTVPIIKPTDISGPFQDALTQQTFKAPPLQPGAGFMGAGGKLAFLGSKILEGFQQGRMRKYMQEENTKQQQWSTFNNLIQNAMANADTPEKRQAISQLYSETVWKGLNENLKGDGKGKGKKGGGEPEGIGGHLKGIIGGIADKIGPIQKGSPSIGDSLPMLNQALQAITGGMPSAQSQGDQGIKMMQEAAQETKASGGWQQDLQSNPKWVKGTELAGRYIAPQQLKSVSDGLVNSFEVKPESRAQEERINQAKATYKRVTGHDLPDEDVAQLLGIKQMVPHIAGFNTPGDKVPADVDAYGQKVDHSAEVNYRFGETDGKWYPAGKSTQSPYIQKVFENKVTGKPEIWAVDKATNQKDHKIGDAPEGVVYKPAVGEDGQPYLVPMPRYGGGGGSSGEASKPEKGTEGESKPDAKKSNLPKGAIPFGEPKPPSEASLAIAQGAEGAMSSGLRAAKELPGLMKQYPWHFGMGLGGAIGTLKEKYGALPGPLARMDTDLHSVAAFLTGVHRARGRGYAEIWAKVLQNPFINPEGSIDALNRAAKIAEEVDARIKKHSYKPVTMEQIIRELDSEGKLKDLDDASVSDSIQVPPNPFAAKAKKGTSEPPGMKPDHVMTPFGPVSKPGASATQ
jgi:hypothetical protein